MAVLITGNRGFIGSHLVRKMKFFGTELYEWDSDIRDIYKCDKQVDTVFHLAGHTRTQQFNQNTCESYSVNISGSLAVSNFCKKTGARCILVSTSGVYKLPEDHSPVSETSEIGPTNEYSLSKWISEDICRRMSEDLDVSTTVLRLFNVYGPGQSSNFLVPYIVDSICDNKIVQIKNPTAVRDFIYIDDVIDALMKVLVMPMEKFSILNIGSGEGHSVMEVLGSVESVVGRKSRIDLSENVDSEHTTLISDIGKAKQKLDWIPMWKLSDGIQMIKLEKMHNTRS